MEINIHNGSTCLICMNTNMLKTARDSINYNILKTVNACIPFTIISQNILL